MAKAKVSPVMEDEEVVAEATTEETQNTDMVVADFSGGGLANAMSSSAMNGKPPFLKIDRKTAAITYDKDIVLSAAGGPLRMLVLDASVEYYTPWNMEEREDGSYFRPRWKSIAEGEAEGYSTEWTEGPDGKKVGPSICPAMDFVAAIQAPDGIGTEFDGCFWVNALVSCCAREFKLAQTIARKAALNPKLGAESWRMEFELSSYAVGDGGRRNNYLTAALKAVHAEDSNFAKEYRATCG